MAKRANKEQLPDVDITLTAKELKKLHGEPAELKAIYLLINWHRDFETNIAGEKTRISFSTFKEGLGHVNKPGRKKWQPTTTHITRWLNQLESLGLIKQLGNYVFYCPLAHTDKSKKKISHQSVTEVSPKNKIGVTKQEVDEHTVFIELKEQLKDEVSPKNKTGVTEVSRRLCLPLLNTNTTNTYTYTAAQNFFDLLAERKFPVQYLLDPKTKAMVQTWVDSGVTIEHARTAMDKCDMARSGRPQYPTYYFNAVIEAKREFDAANAKAKKVMNDKPTTTHKQVVRRSTNEVFWERLGNPEPDSEIG
jgi:hypothetical protein